MLVRCSRYSGKFPVSNTPIQPASTTAQFKNATALRTNWKTPITTAVLVVDAQGLLLAVAVHPADIQDRDGARLLLAWLCHRFPRLRLLWADAGYADP